MKNALWFAVLFLLPYGSSGQDVNVLQKLLAQTPLRETEQSFYLRTDRRLYAPGDKVWFQVFALDGRDAKPYTSRKLLTVQLSNTSQTALQQTTATINNGTGSGMIPIPSGVKEGIYALKIYDGGSVPVHKTTIGVRKQAFPSFLISFEVPDEKLFPGSQVTATVRFLDHGAEPLRKVPFEFFLNDGTGERLVFEGESDVTGTSRLSFDIPAELATGLLGFGISASYHGDTEILQGCLNIIPSKGHMRLAPEGGRLLAGISNKVAFQAVDSYGNLLPCTAELLREGSGAIQTFTSETGLGFFEFVPETAGRYYVRITEPLLMEGVFMLPTVEDGGIAIRLKERKQHSIVIAVENTYPSFKGLLAIRNRNRIIWSSVLSKDTPSTMEIPFEDTQGFVDCVVLNDRMEVESQRVILWKFPELLPVTLRTDMPIYQPREEVRVAVDTRGTGSFTQSFSAVFKSWRPEIHDIRWLSLRDDPCMDMLTAWGLTQTASVQETDLLTTLIGNKKVWSNDAPKNEPGIPAELVENRNFMTDTRLLYSVTHDQGTIKYSNSKADDYFLLGNADYLRTLRPKPPARKESYKYLLENGTPVRDVVRKIRPYDLDGASIVFAGRRTSLIAQGGALIVVDGIPVGTSVSLLDQIVPYDVEAITVSTDPQDIQRYTGLNSVGLIEITMKRGSAEEKKAAKGNDLDFTSPEYKSGGRVKGGRDFRTTLYWNSDPSDVSVGQIRYHNGDLVGTVLLTVVLMDEDGRFGYAEVSYEIRL